MDYGRDTEDLQIAIKEKNSISALGLQVREEFECSVLTFIEAPLMETNYGPPVAREFFSRC